MLNVRTGGMPPCHGTVMLSIKRMRPLKRYILGTSLNTASSLRGPAFPVVTVTIAAFR